MRSAPSPGADAALEARADAIGAYAAAFDQAPPAPVPNRPAAAAAPPLPPEARDWVPDAGRPLSDADRARFEPLVGDLERVRIHTGPRARAYAKSAGARAYAVGENVVVGEPFSTDTASGRQFLGHELAHVAQQREGGAVRLQRQPPVGGPSAPRARASTTALGNMQLQSTLQIVPNPIRDTSLPLPPELQHTRDIHITTPDGADLTVTIRASAVMPFGFDTSTSPDDALDLPSGNTGIGYTILGHLADGTPVTVMGTANSTDGESLRAFAAHHPRFTHFGLSPEEQYRAIFDYLNAQGLTTVPTHDPDADADRRRASGEVQYPAQEDYERLSEAERRDLASEKFWEELSGWNVLLGIILGVAIIALAIGAIAAAAAGMVGAAMALAALAIIGLAWGLWSVISSAYRDAIARWAEGNVADAILTVIKGLALAGAIILGAIVLIASVIAGEVVLVGLAIAAVVLLVVAAIAGIILMFRDLDHAAESDHVDDFRRYVQRGAREAEEAIINVVLIIVGWVMGRFGRNLLPRPSLEPELPVEVPQTPGEGRGPVVVEPEPSPPPRVRPGTEPGSTDAPRTPVRPPPPADLKPGEIWVDTPDRIVAGPRDEMPGHVEYYLYDSESGAEFCLVEQELSAPNTPEGGPHLTLTPKTAVLPDGTTVSLRAPFPWTRVALARAVEVYRAQYGHPPPDLTGPIAWQNLANFQMEYAAIREANPGMSQAEIGSRAAAQISYGRHRIAIGYGDLTARMSYFGDVTVTDRSGASVTLHDVPWSVTIEARPTTSP